MRFADPRTYFLSMGAYWVVFGLITTFYVRIMDLFQTSEGGAAGTAFSDHVWFHGGLDILALFIGVVPNCDPYLEVWPPAFRTYNVMVPNLLNLPFMVWGFGAPRSTLGLAMYVSNHAAGCMYCSAHSCTFALRRGATVDEVASALDEQESLAEANRAAVRVARSLAIVPAAIDDEDRAELRRHFSETDAEWIVLYVAMMGFLNKAMDALGVPLEEDTA